MNPAPQLLVASDMDGTLTTSETWRAVLQWVLAHRPTPAARRFVALRLPVVLLARLGLISKERFRGWWLAEEARLLRGLSAHDLTVMGEWVVEHHLWPARRAHVVDAVRAAHAAARAIDPTAELLLATGGYQPVGAAFAQKIGAQVALGTPLAMAGERATGDLAAPTQSGEEKARAVAGYANGRTLVAAFGDTLADVPLLALAQRAIAVAPDAALRRVARDRNWEILEANPA
jgi:phosphoserine phosphatase